MQSEDNDPAEDVVRGIERLSVSGPTPLPESDVISDGNFSERHRKLLDAIRALKQTGLEIDLELPRIAVIGSNNTGKSSLLNTVFGSTLPRTSGLCTRCPIEFCLMKSDVAWHCQVSYRFAASIEEKHSVSASKIPFGGPVYRSNDAEARIHHAQRALLHPQHSPERFLREDYNASTDGALAFTDDCVCVDVFGPDLVDMTFIDLPGVATSAQERSNAQDIMKITRVLEKYISQPSTIILLAISCGSDLASQEAFQLARSHDPSGLRTIGVLTKPDLIHKGEELPWISIVDQQQFILANGWYCVQQLKTPFLGTGHTENMARKAERAFFERTEPWRALTSSMNERLGTQHLIRAISHVFSKLISARLPDTYKEARHMLELTEKHLRDLPPLPTDAVNQIFTNLMDFENNLRREVDGTTNPEGFIQSIKQYQLKFRTALQFHAPVFLPVSRREVPPSFVLSRRPDFVPGPDDDESEQPPLFADDVVTRLERARSRELPGNYPDSVKFDILTECMAHWRDQALSVSGVIRGMFGAKAHGLLLRQFKRYISSGLLAIVQANVSEELTKASKRTTETIEQLVRWESAPFSINEAYFVEYKNKFQCHYLELRDAIRNGAKEQSTVLSPPQAFEPSSTQTSPARAQSPPTESQFPMQEAVVEQARIVSLNGSRAHVYRMTDDVDPDRGGRHIQYHSLNVMPEYIDWSPEELRVIDYNAQKESKLEEAAQVQRALDALAELGYTDLLPSDLTRLKEQDPADTAIEVMSEIRAYYQVSCQRFADNVLLAIDHEFIRSFSGGIRDSMVKELALTAHDAQQRCSLWTREEEGNRLLREELETKWQRLQKALNVMTDVMTLTKAN